MEESNKSLNIKFEGRLDNLVIKYGEEILYSYKREKKKVREKTEKEKANQSRTAIVAAFCSQINQIPALEYVWKRWPKKKKSGYRNMLAANSKLARPTRLINLNKIAPKSPTDINSICKSIDIKGINIEIPVMAKRMELLEVQETITLAVINCVYNPMKESSQLFNLFSRSQELLNYDPKRNYNLSLQFQPIEKKEIGLYNNMIVFTTILFSTHDGRPEKWISTSAKEFVLNKKKMWEEIIIGQAV
jgi:hypothetical protein